jgi:GNAT superfamily N-acetyltransferase
MSLYPAVSADLAAVAALVNSAYRGDSSRQGWTTEADYIGGQRTDPETLADDLAAAPDALLMTWRDAPGGPLLGCFWLEPHAAQTWYLGMLTVRPDIQARQLGRRMLAAGEAWAVARGAARMRITVVNVRDELIAWYVRRGYALTGDWRPFPAGDPRFGIPVRDDLRLMVLEKPLEGLAD